MKHLFSHPLIALFLCASILEAAPEEMLLPTALAPRSGDQVYVACEGNKSVILVDMKEKKISARHALPFVPSGLLLSGQSLWITGALPQGNLARLDTASGKLSSVIPLALGARGPVMGPDGSLCVPCRFSSVISIVDTTAMTERLRIPVARDPVAATFMNRLLYVAHQFPDMAANGPSVNCQVSVVDVKAGKVTGSMLLPNGSTDVNDLTGMPDGSLLFVVYNLTRFDLPATQVERGWMNTAALSIFKPNEALPWATVLLDDPENGAANPHAVRMAPDASRLYVAHAGTHEASIIPVAPLLSRIRESKDRASLAEDLSFLQGLRSRVKTGGNGTRTLEPMGNGVVCADYFSESLTWMHGALPSSSLAKMDLRPGASLSLARRGERFFNDAMLCVQHWQSCASCHPDGRMDAINWDLLNDGIGNPKNVRSLLYAHRRSPVMSHGIRASADVAVRSGIKNILFTVQPEETALALDAYLKSMEPAPSPWLSNGQLGPKAKRGKEVFHGKTAACAECHPSPLWTDMKLHDVLTRSPLDNEAKFLTPTLVECWRTAPYMHDGRCATMRAALMTGQAHGDAFMKLTPEDQEALIEFVLSL